MRKRNRHPATCETLKQFLPDYVRETLSGEQEQAVKTHLEQCPRCLRDVEDMQWIRNTLHDYPEEYVFAHVSPEDIIAYGDGKSELSAERKTLIEKHLSVCGRCNREFEILQAVNSDLCTPEIQKQIRFHRPIKIAGWLRGIFKRPSKPVQRMRYAAILAAVVMVLLILPQYFPDSSATPGVLPSAEVERGVMNKSVTLLKPRDQDVVTVPDPEFYWESESGVLHYVFYVYMDDGTLIWKAEVDTNWVRLPQDRRLHNERKYVWGVDAFLGPEATVESGLFQFETRFGSVAENDTLQ